MILNVLLIVGGVFLCGFYGFYLAKKMDNFMAGPTVLPEEKRESKLAGNILVCGKSPYAAAVLNYLEENRISYIYYENNSELYEERHYRLALAIDDTDYNNIAFHAYCKRFLTIDTFVIVCNDPVYQTLINSLGVCVLKKENMPQAVNQKVREMAGGQHA